MPTCAACGNFITIDETKCPRCSAVTGALGPPPYGHRPGLLWLISLAAILHAAFFVPVVKGVLVALKDDQHPSAALLMLLGYIPAIGLWGSAVGMLFGSRAALNIFCSVQLLWIAMPIIGIVVAVLGLRPQDFKLGGGVLVHAGIAVCFLLVVVNSKAINYYFHGNREHTKTGDGGTAAT